MAFGHSKVGTFVCTFVVLSARYSPSLLYTSSGSRSFLVTSLQVCTQMSCSWKSFEVYGASADSYKCLLRSLKMQSSGGSTCAPGFRLPHSVSHYWSGSATSFRPTTLLRVSSWSVFSGGGAYFVIIVSCLKSQTRCFWPIKRCRPLNSEQLLWQMMEHDSSDATMRLSPYVCQTYLQRRRSSNAILLHSS